MVIFIKSIYYQNLKLKKYNIINNFDFYFKIKFKYKTKI